MLVVLKLRTPGLDRQVNRWMKEPGWDSELLRHTAHYNKSDKGAMVMVPKCLADSSRFN